MPPESIIKMRWVLWLDKEFKFVYFVDQWVIDLHRLVRMIPREHFASVINVVTGKNFTCRLRQSEDAHSSKKQRTYV